MRWVNELEYGNKLSLRRGPAIMIACPDSGESAKSAWAWGNNPNSMANSNHASFNVLDNIRFSSLWIKGGRVKVAR